MKIYGKQNVFDAALDRIRYLFNEFPEIIVGVSGGKDSTVIFNLCMQVAREKQRIPLTVMWIDQEVEWQGTVDMVEYWMTLPDVRSMWFQMPMVITNNASSFERYNYCWRESDSQKWTHEKHPLSIKENNYGTDRFHELFQAIIEVEYIDKKACYISGVRTEESPRRLMGLTHWACYKWITWGRSYKKSTEHYCFYPIYDWTWRDVWKAIHDKGWKYNRIYDAYYQYGIPPIRMRISNLHHETAIQNLLLVQKIEPETWIKVADRIVGANTIKHLKKWAFTCPKELPFMFHSWPEYTEYLIEHIIQEDGRKREVKVKFERGLEFNTDYEVQKAFCKVIIDTILSSDWDWTKIENFMRTPSYFSYREWKRGDINQRMLDHSQYLPKQAIQVIKHKLGKGA